MNLIEANINNIIRLCKKYRVKKLYVFGSILTDRFTECSDIDFSVDFDSEAINKEKLDWADTFFNFIHDMETLLGRRVDMVVDKYVKNKYFRQELDETKQLIYG
ncbi:MAG: nucleotidyltransferase domain-containing protein [Muribaculaceae bacterium]|nr:nucleotidyltransferase domain-containing protein [Muribaculaceae bacterium]